MAPSLRAASAGLALLLALAAAPGRAAALAAGPAGRAGSTAARPAALTAATAVAPLASDRVHLGLASQPGQQLDWLHQTGIAFRYRYQYLAGGVNTPSNWTTWQDPALPPGQFVLDYVSDSRGAPGSPVSVFTWYQLLQSSPSTGSDEAGRDLSNLNNVGTMTAYYQSFTLMLQRASQAGGQIVAHVEPDLWGYLEGLARGGPASSVSAAVSSTGNADLAGIPNTAEGFADALLRLRDRYAPNVVMALHASSWATGRDIDVDGDPALDPVAVADTTASFLATTALAANPFGSTWDVVFNDVDDHDAGWWEAQRSLAPPDTHWWDPADSRVPDGARWLAFMGELHLRTGRQLAVWQVPLGDQRYLTMNNTCGHYQDSVGAYLLSHEAQLHAAGLVAVMFGAGNPCQTSYDDATHDGVTNNGGAPTSDAGGWCSACNTVASTVADDDGGFLRVEAPRYYANPPPCATLWVAIAQPADAPGGAGDAKLAAALPHTAAPAPAVAGSAAGSGAVAAAAAASAAQRAPAAPFTPWFGGQHRQRCP